MECDFQCTGAANEVVEKERGNVQQQVNIFHFFNKPRARENTLSCQSCVYYPSNCWLGNILAVFNQWIFVVWNFLVGVAFILTNFKTNLKSSLFGTSSSTSTKSHFVSILIGPLTGSIRSLAHPLLWSRALKSACPCLANQDGTSSSSQLCKVHCTLTQDALFPQQNKSDY